MADDARTTTPFFEGGPYAHAHVDVDGWNINLRFDAGDESRTYVFSDAEASRLLEALQRRIPTARHARSAPASEGERR